LIENIKYKLHSIFKKLALRFGIDIPYFIKNGFWTVLNQLVSLALSFAVSVVLARFLSVKVFGQYQFILSFFTLFSIFSLPGLNVSVARAAAKGLDSSLIQGKMASFKWSFLGSFGLTGLGLYYLSNDEQTLGVGLVLCAVAFPFYHSYSFWENFLLGKAKFSLIAYFKIVQVLVFSIVLGSLVIFFPDKLILVIVAYLILNTGFNIIWHYVSLKYVIGLEIDPECLPYGIYLSKLGFLGILVSQFDKIILGFFDIELLAVYVIALKILDAVNGLAKSLASVTFPKFVKEKVHIGWKLILFIFITGFIISLVLFYASGPIITLFFTDKYNASVAVFEKLTFVIPLIMINLVLINKVNAQMDKGKILETRILAPIISIIGSVFIFVISKNTSYFVVGKVYLLQLGYLFFLLKRKSK
jgi:O-antigen/teichoic acid export membrane protein